MLGLRFTEVCDRHGFNKNPHLFIVSLGQSGLTETCEESRHILPLKLLLATLGKSFCACSKYLLYSIWIVYVT